MSLYESIAARLIGTPLQRPAEWLRDMRGARFRKSHPELAEWFREGERTDHFLQQVLEAAGFKTDDVKLWVWHQANIRVRRH